MKILIAEDEHGIRQTMAMMLKARGYDVVECEGGVEAFEQFKTSSFDLIISDIRMPEGSGDIFLKNVRETNKEIPFIVMTGYSELDEDELLSLGANCVLSKPFNPGPFFETIKSFQK